jgi:hypothetical protein
VKVNCNASDWAGAGVAATATAAAGRAALVNSRSGQPSNRMTAKANAARSNGEPRIYFNASTMAETLCFIIPS